MRGSQNAVPTTHDLTLAANAAAGYDDNLTGGTGAGTTPAAMASGTTQSLEAALGYFRGNTARSFRVASTGRALAYPGNLAGLAAGGVASLDAMTRMGQTWIFRTLERVGSEPFFNVFSSGAAGAPLAGIQPMAPATGLFERRSRSFFSSVSIDREWNRRDWTSLSYSYGMERLATGRGDSNSQRFGLEYRRHLTPRTRMRAEYRHVRGDYTDYNGLLLPTREHTLEGGPEIDTVLSRRRRLTLSLAAGASHFDSIGSISREPYRAWVPVGSASAMLVLSPALSLDAGYRRGFSLLQGITDEVYATDMASVTTRMLLTRRTDVRVGASFSNWKTALTPGVAETLRVYGASLQLTVPLAARLAATASYFYYHHRYSNPAQLPPGFPAAYERQAVRVGMTIWVPLVGTPSSPPVIPR